MMDSCSLVAHGSGPSKERGGDGDDGLNFSAKSANIVRMGNIGRALALALAVSALAASAKQSKPFTPAEAVAKEGWTARAVRVLTTRGETVETKDEEAGVVVTAWRDLTQIGTTYRLRWNVTAEGGIIRVVSQCEFRMKDDDPLMSNEWQSCGDNQPGDRSGEAEAIAAEIGR